VEETALIESLEGKRGNPQPPSPAVSGLWSNPTVVNNVETIASVPWIVNNSGDDYAKIGIGRSTGTKLISASGHVKILVFEIELGLSVYEFMNSDEYLGGMSSDRPLKALVPEVHQYPFYQQI
jgi:NADH-quinone oxidoreductase subunit F